MLADRLISLYFPGFKIDWTLYAINHRLDKGFKIFSAANYLPLATIYHHFHGPSSHIVIRGHGYPVSSYVHYSQQFALDRLLCQTAIDGQKIAGLAHRPDDIINAFL